MSNTISLEQCVRNSLERYFEDLGDSQAHDVLAMVVHRIERPVLELVLEKAQGNQTKAAEMLGITRSTLRKKLQAHNLQP